MTTDQQAIDKIADILAEPEWSGADFLEWIADVIGTVRPHPGGYPTRKAYAKVFAEATGRDVIELGDEDEDEPEEIEISLEIDNAYEDGHEVTTHVTTRVPKPEDVDDEDEMADWWGEYIEEHTGAGYGIAGQDGFTRTLDATYTVKIVKSDEDPRLVGLTYEWGG